MSNGAVSLLACYLKCNILKEELNHTIYIIIRVCKRWKKAAYDEVLWYDLNLGDSYISLIRLRKFMRHSCFPNAQSIRLCGNMDKRTRFIIYSYFKLKAQKKTLEFKYMHSEFLLFYNSSNQ